jgi:hypothetical protein
MAEQLTFDQATEVPVDPSRATPAERWDRFVTVNPHAKAAIVDCARQLDAQGRRVTIAVVWEELRGRVHTRGDVYRWDNSLRAPCAAWLRQEHPGLARHMRTRKGR